MAFWDKGNKFPYTNNHDANLDYMMSIFENIKNEWHDLYVDLVEWKGTTTLELNTWKTNALAQIEQYETDFRAEIAVWKANTEQDIGVWEQSVLADLGTWRANFETLFATTFSNLTQIKTDAEAARDAAALSATAAAGSATEAAASATSVSSALTQIQTNTGDISDLKTQLTYIPLSIYADKMVIGRSIDSGGSISNQTPTSSLSSLIDVDEGETIEFPDIKDGNNVQLIYLVAKYNSSGTFTSRETVTGKLYAVEPTTKKIRIAFLRSSATSVPMTEQDIETYFNGKIYNLGLREYNEIQSLLPLLNRQFWILGKKLNLQWTKEYLITAEGDLTYNKTFATSDYLPVFESENFVFDAVEDNNNIPLSTLIAEYDDDKRFLRRSSALSSNTPIIIDGETKYIRFSFGRPTASDIKITDEDIATYFGGKVYQTGERIQTELNENTSEIVPYVFKGTWEFEKTVTKSGNVASATTYALSSYANVDSIVGFRTLEIADNNDNSFTTLIACFDDEHRFLGRFNGDVVFTPEMKYFRIIFGRSVSTGIAPTQNTINAYFKINRLTKAYLESVSAVKRDVPKNVGVLNCIKNAKQLALIKYNTTAVLPNQIADYPANTTLNGIPYSSVRLYDKFVGLNVSLHTFMTAIHDPNSVIYTEIMETPNAKTYYGEVCSSFTAYCLNSPVREITRKILANTTDYITKDINEIELGDICVNDSHIVIITDIIRSWYGEILYVVTTEALPPKCMITSYTFEEFKAEVNLKSYRIASYNNISKVTYAPSKYIPLYNETKQRIDYSPICINYGDKAMLPEGSEIVVHVLDSTNATGIDVYKENTKIDSYPVGSVTLSNLEVGTYTVQLMNGSTVLGETVCSVCDATISKNDNRISFSCSSNCIPLYISFNDETGTAYNCIELTPEDIANGYIDSDYHGTGANWLKIYVGNDFGSTAFGITI